MDAAAGATVLQVVVDECHGTRLEGFDGFEALGPSVGRWSVMPSSAQR